VVIAEYAAAQVSGAFEEQPGRGGFPCAAVATFRTQVTRLWHEALERRRQRTRINWARMNRIANRWLPPARVKHPFPDARFHATTQGRSPVR
jgi:RNA-directed DNA polymerase